MAHPDQRPWVLWGGLGLTAVLALTHVISRTIAQSGGELTLALAVLGGVTWWWRGRSSPVLPSPTVITPDRQAVEREWRMIDRLLTDLTEEEPSPSPEQVAHQKQRQALAQTLDRSHLTLAIVGGAETGKTSLHQALTQAWPTSQITWLEIDPAHTDPSSLLTNLDGAIFLTNGDLTQSDWQSFQALQSLPALVLGLNKVDLHPPHTQTLLLTKLQTYLQDGLAQVPLVSVAANPRPQLRRKLDAQGSWQEQSITPPPSLTDLLNQIQPWVQDDRLAQLVWATTHRQSQALKQDIHHHLNRLRRVQALQQLQKAQWLAAGTTALNPLASLDLLATLAINGQLVMDLSRIYHQPVTLAQGKTLATTLGRLLVSLGLVEMTTQTLSSILKTHHVTYWMGATVQGISAAYLTRLAGLTLIDYWESLEPGVMWDGQGETQGWSQRLQRTFQQLQETSVVRSFAQSALQHLPLGSFVSP